MSGTLRDEEVKQSAGILPADGRSASLPIIAVDMPVLFEDEGQEEMGETDVHVRTTHILYFGLKVHLANRPQYRVFSNMNVYYHPVKRWAYVSPDAFAVIPYRALGENVTSYHIGEDGPPPLLAGEVLSRRSFQQQDLTNKPVIYSDLGIAEYILMDVTGIFLPERLLLKRLLEDRSWQDEQDRDGGVTSQLGFRLIVDNDGQLRMLNSATGKPYFRPDEVQGAFDAEAKARQKAEAAEQQERRAREQADIAREKEKRALLEAEARLRELKEELARLQGKPKEGAAPQEE